jgi:hypothetical protein
LTTRSRIAATAARRRPFRWRLATSAAAIPKPSSDNDVGSNTLGVDKALLPLSLMK